MKTFVGGLLAVIGGLGTVVSAICLNFWVILLTTLGHGIYVGIAGATFWGIFFTGLSTILCMILAGAVGCLLGVVVTTIGIDVMS